MDNATRSDDQPTPYVEVTERFVIIPEALLYDSAIPADAVRLYGALRRHGSDPSNCYPSHRRLAELIGKSPRSIQGWVRQLEEAGWIERVQRTTPSGDPDSNGYRVYGRVQERGVRAGERGGVRAGDEGGYALGNAPKESKGNESKVERESRAAAPSLRLALSSVEDREEATPGMRTPLGGDLLPTLPDANGSGFDAFWAVYPRKVAKGAARTAWTKAARKVAPAEILAGAVAYASDPERKPDFTKHPATWLNAECWDDDHQPERRRSKGSLAAERLLQRRTSAQPIDVREISP